MHIACEAAICMLRLRYVCDMYATFCDMYARLRYVCYGFSCPPMHEHHLLPLTLLRCAKGVPAEIALLGDSFRNILRTFFSAETHPLYGILFFLILMLPQYWLVYHSPTILTSLGVSLMLELL